MSAVRGLALIALALALAVGFVVVFVPRPASAAVPSIPSYAPAVIICSTIADAQLAFELKLEMLGAPAASAMITAVPSRGAVVVTLWISGNPTLMNLVFVDNCLAGSYLTPVE